MAQTSSVSTLLPHWTVKTLGEVCNISIGKTPARDKARYWDTKKNTNNIWLSIADLSKLVVKKTIFNSKEYLSDEGSKLFTKIESGTLLLSFKLSIGKVAFTGKELQTNEAIASLPIIHRNINSSSNICY